MTLVYGTHPLFDPPITGTQDIGFRSCDRARLNGLPSSGAQSGDINCQLKR